MTKDSRKVEKKRPGASTVEPSEEGGGVVGATGSDALPSPVVRLGGRAVQGRYSGTDLNISPEDLPKVLPGVSTLLFLEHELPPGFGHRADLLRRYISTVSLPFVVEALRSSAGESLVDRSGSPLSERVHFRALDLSHVGDGFLGEALEFTCEYLFPREPQVASWLDSELTRHRVFIALQQREVEKVEVASALLRAAAGEVTKTGSAIRFLFVGVDVEAEKVRNKVTKEFAARPATRDEEEIRLPALPGLTRLMVPDFPELLLGMGEKAKQRLDRQRRIEPVLRTFFERLRAENTYPTAEAKETVAAEILELLRRFDFRLACPSHGWPAILEVRSSSGSAGFFRFRHLRPGAGGKETCSRHSPGEAHAAQESLPVLIPIAWDELPRTSPGRRRSR